LPRTRKILIDATGVTREKAGVGVYARNLIHNLTQTQTLTQTEQGAGEMFQLFILAQDDDRELDFGGHAGVEMVWVPARVFRRLLPRFLLEQIYLPYLLRRLGIDVLHSLHYAFPLMATGTRRVVTIHDMTFFNMPDVHERRKAIYFRFFMRAARHFGVDLIFISRSAQEDFVARLGSPRGRGSVIPHGRDESFTAPTDRSAGEGVRAKYGLPERFVLYIGTIEPRKNLERLVRAFAAIAAEDGDVDLVLVGKMGWMMDGLPSTIEGLDLTSRVIFTGFIPEAEKPLMLGACEVFVYPSLYEGFGLPALEALACGAPTITSNTSSLPEVVGDAAMLIDPTKVEELTLAMRTMLASASLRDEYRRKGLEQARRFSWQRTAAMTAEVYLSSRAGDVR
jgi:glycosyltransferase involved in cell wall biosynthesis